eukprot:3054069-Rhodomonas_salina.2
MLVSDLISPLPRPPLLSSSPPFLLLSSPLLSSPPLPSPLLSSPAPLPLRLPVFPSSSPSATPLPRPPPSHPCSLPPSLPPLAADHQGLSNYGPLHRALVHPPMLL